MKKIVLLCGHNGILGQTGDSGAINPTYSSTWSKEDGLGSEFEMVRHVVKNVWERCTDMSGVRTVLCHRGIESGAYSLLPEEVNDIEGSLVIEVHLNSVGNTSVDGSEVLYWYTSSNGKKYADIIQKQLVSKLGLADRGLKPITANDRGANLLRKTKAPAVIVEGFFISALTSKDDRDKKLKLYEDALVDAIHELVKIIK